MELPEREGEMNNDAHSGVLSMNSWTLLFKSLSVPIRVTSGRFLSTQLTDCANLRPSLVSYVQHKREDNFPIQVKEEGLKEEKLREDNR